MPIPIADRRLDVESTIEQWQILGALNIYRWTLALLLVALDQTELVGELFHDSNVHRYGIVADSYIAFCLAVSLLLSIRKPNAIAQTYIHFSGDLAAVLLLLTSTGGITSGTGMLLIAPTAAASLLLSRRMAVLIASIASLAILGEEIYRQLNIGFQPGELSQAGILGLLILLAALVANALAGRAQRSEAAARQAGIDLRDLANLNERIIQRMETGVIALDAGGTVQLINESSKSLLGIRGLSAGQQLSQLSPPLAEYLSRRDEALVEQRIDIGGRVIVPTVTRVGRGRNISTLVFLEDGERASAQAQQMKLAALGTLTASIAHEIRNPLGAISHAGQLLNEAETDDSDRSSLLGIIARHTARINTIVENVLGLTRQGDTVREQINLKEWLAGFVHDYSDGHKAPPSISIDSVDAGLVISFDPSHFQQVLSNLWDNAQRHGTGEPVEVEISTGTLRARNRSYMDVQNAGNPIPSDAVPRIFEPFYTQNNQGSGLGLYIARELCELNGARLEYVGTTRRDPTFRIVFSEPKKGI